MIVNIPLDDCGLHGLGVTVYGRCSRKKAEDVGIYIKGVQPGGAAAKVIMGVICYKRRDYYWEMR